jgi:transcriptional regulator with XRE-family HTH domain
VTKARDRQGWSVRVLAAKARLSPETVAKIERGSVDPRLSTVRRLAGALEVSASYLAFG